MSSEPDSAIVQLLVDAIHSSGPISVDELLATIPGLPMDKKQEYLAAAIRAIANMDKPKQILAAMTKFTTDNDIDLVQLVNDNAEVAKELASGKVDIQKLGAVVVEDATAVAKCPCFVKCFQWPKTA